MKVAVSLVALATLGAACSSGATTLKASGEPVNWIRGQAEAANGMPPSFTAAGVCGSDTATYLAELANGGNPLQAKVLHEWSDIVPGGKQLLVSGSVATTHLGPTDNPITHPYGDDLSMDVKLDQPFMPFSRQLGPAEEAAGEMHVEISSGLIPHEVRASQASATQTWRQLSDFNLTGFQSGFDKPALGDRILVMGRYIIDCGHPNYGTELHPMAFLAWTHHQGATTVAHAYFNPYRDTEAYTTDSSIIGKVDDTTRLSQTQPFPQFFVSEVLRAINGTVDHLSSKELVEATHTSPAPWQVCAPSGTSGSHLQVNYDIVTRPGVEVKVTPEPSSSCARITVVLGSSYRPMDARLRQCVLPWTYLSQISQQAYGTSLDIQGLIHKFVASPAARAIVDRDPGTTCADALAGPHVDPAPSGQRIQVDASQPFPFYGVITAKLT
jgi:uncharacterized phage-associated protein